MVGAHDIQSSPPRSPCPRLNRPSVWVSPYSIATPSIESARGERRPHYVHNRGSIHQTSFAERGIDRHAGDRAQSHTGWPPGLPPVGRTPFLTSRLGPWLAWQLSPLVKPGCGLIFSRTPTPTLLVVRSLFRLCFTPYHLSALIISPLSAHRHENFSRCQCDSHFVQGDRRNVEDGPHLALATVSHTTAESHVWRMLWCPNGSPGPVVCCVDVQYEQAVLILTAGWPMGGGRQALDAALSAPDWSGRTVVWRGRTNVDLFLLARGPHAPR
ncbi:uncharacterized protein B0H64DRAFT_229014 [Chaetomium fimeti]|uniref:Uncharacterized protein n=1 Tax=Chaetomium fimeti TaxID=1854472 RepID=A0AAE0LPT0_9PEZI|nr:hypothetical protein B0H64DRAFT_229014 [Chaetomium fimeti]